MNDSGLEILRRGVQYWRKRRDLITLSGDADIAVSKLEAFAEGKGTLPIVALDALAKRLHDATYDAAIDKLRLIKPSVILPTSTVLAKPFYVDHPVSNFFKGLAEE